MMTMMCIAINGSVSENRRIIHNQQSVDLSYQSDEGEHGRGNHDEREHAQHIALAANGHSERRLQRLAERSQCVPGRLNPKHAACGQSDDTCGGLSSALRRAARKIK